MTEVRVWFVTNRNYQPENKKQVFGKSINPDGVAGLRFGWADFERDPRRPSLKNLHIYPDKKGVEEKLTGGWAFLEDLRKVMAKGEKTDTLAFIHGFNVTFTGALEAGAHLAQSLVADGRPVNVVVFTWPSDGAAVPLMSYYSDREDARASGAAIARAFLKFRDYVLTLKETDYCQRRVHLLVHSMGAYVLRNGLQALLAKDKDSLTRLFDQILLAAPDEDDDTFETDAKLKLLPRIGRQVTVYFNPRDKGLLISDKTKANPDRLGSDGPRMVDLLPKKIVLVDCRRVAGDADPHVEHSYYIRSKSMTADICAVLEDRLPPEDIDNREYIPALRAYRIEAETGMRPVYIPPPPKEEPTPTG